MIAEDQDGGECEGECPQAKPTVSKPERNRCVTGIKGGVGKHDIVPETKGPVIMKGKGDVDGNMSDTSSDGKKSRQKEGSSREGVVQPRIGARQVGSVLGSDKIKNASGGVRG